MEDLIIALVGGAGASPPILPNATFVTWLVGLCVAPWPLAFFFARVVAKKSEATLLAYNCAAMTPNICLAIIGCRAWWFDEAVAAAGAGTTHDRLYMPIAPSATTIISVCMAYELWNTFACLLIPEYRTAAVVGHHATTLYLALLSTAPFLHYYGVFFVGVTAASSVWLAFVDIFRYMESLAARLPTLNLVMRLLFALTFIATRTIMWPLVSVRFWIDVVSVMRDGTAHSVWACGVYLAANVFLTCLQLLWSVKIIQGLVKAVAGGGSSEKKAS